MGSSGEDVRTAQEQVHKLNELLEDLEKIGVKSEALEALKKQLGLLQKAIDTGVDVADAAAQTSGVLAQLANAADEACGDDGVCQAAYARQFQARNVNFVLDLKNQNSVARNFFRKTLQ